MPPSHACDRCYSLKVRCLSGPAAKCYRCYRLHKLCTFYRRRGKRGPKPRTLTPNPLESSGEPGSLSSSINTPYFRPYPVGSQAVIDQGDQSAQELALATILRHEALFAPVPACTASSICSFFSLGPQLSMDMYRMIRSRVAEAPALLLRPYVAVSRVFPRCNANNKTPCSEADWSSCASALQALRGARISRPEHVGIFVSLGMSLVTFHRLISGISASSICRFTLSLIRSSYYSEQLSESGTMGLVYLVFLDTTQSLFRAQVPVIEYRVKDPCWVDQQAGLCGRLLPLLYRLCLLGASIRAGDGQNILPSSFDKLQEELNAWAPTVSQTVRERFSGAEMSLLIAQASLHRTGALLFLHRLRYPFGERDAEAGDLARSIVDGMEHCLTVAGRYPPNMTLILLVAGAEMHDMIGKQRILLLVSRILGSNFYPFIANLRLFLRRVWAGRDQRRTRYLFQLFEEDPEISIPL